MNLKQLIKFGIEESSVPVIKNPILRAALEPRSTVPGPRNMADGGRIGLFGGGFLKLLYKGKSGLQHGAIERKLRKEYIETGMDKFKAYDKAMHDAFDVVNQKKLKIVKDKMSEVNIQSDDYVALIDEHIRIVEPDFYKDIKRWDSTRPDLADKQRALFFPDWAEARYGADYEGVLQRKQARALRENIDPNFKEPLSPADQMVSDIDDMNKANLDELLEGRKKNAYGGRAGYNDGQLVTPNVDGSRPGYKGIKDYPEDVQKRIKNFGVKKYNNLTNEQKYAVRTPRTSTTPYSFKFGKNKFDATVTGLTKKGANNVQNLLNLINEKDLTPNKWFARTSKKSGAKAGLDSLARDIVKYLKGETVTNINQKIFDTIDIKNLIGEDKVNNLSTIDGKSFRQTKATIGSAKTKVESTFKAVKLLNKEFMLDPDATIEELAERLYGKGASNSVRALQDTQADIAKYLDVLKTGTRAGVKIPDFKYPSAKQVFEILDSIEDRSSTFGFQDGVIRDLKFNIRDDLLNFKKGSTMSLTRMLSEVIAGSDFAGNVIDHAVGLSASYDKLPGYTEATQILPKELNQLKASEIDKPFNKIINKVYDGTATSKEIKAYNKVARDFMKKHKIDVPIIKSTVTGNDIKSPQKYIRNFNSFSPEAQKHILKIAKDKNFVIQTGAKPLALQEGKATMETAEKFLKGDKKALDFIIKTLEKQKVPVGERGFLATAMLKDLGKLGIRGVKLVRWLQPELEPIFEGLVYQYAKQYQGLPHDLAREELFLPKIIAKFFPDFYKTFIGPEFKTGILEGADPLLEKELYTHTDPREFVYFDGKEFKNPNFGKPTGKVDSRVLQYINAVKDQDRIYDAIIKKERLQKQNELSEASIGAGYGEIPPVSKRDLDKASANVRDLAKTGTTMEYVNRILKPGSMASQAYNTAVEKHRALEDRRKEAALKKYDPRALERKQKSFDIYLKDKEGEFLLNDKGEKIENPRSLYKKRYEEMEKMYPTTDFNDKLIDNLLRQSKYYINPKFKSERRRVENPEGLEFLKGFTYDTLRNFYEGEEKKELDQQKQSYFAENFRTEKAEGGIMNLKKKW